MLTYVPDVDHFVPPSGLLLDDPDFTATPDSISAGDAAAALGSTLGRRPAGTTSVLYLTSDAGEGKTTLINHVARHQAELYKAKQTDWLMVPISLGGRTFLRFDDVVVGALVNRLRFQLFYFEAFLELVKLGVLVPAFDGFEEMIIESSPGEAISALGNLVRSLSSSGSLLVAARRAYFEYRSFRTQARLFDAIGGDSVAFARLALNRWSRAQFVAYASNRGLAGPADVYEAVADRLGPDHPLLTRAVLARRTVDIAASVQTLSELLDMIGQAPQDYFFQFVNALVVREAHEKWLDRSGESAQPLLTVEEHHELLGMVAQEMWRSSVDALRIEIIGIVADMFADAKGYGPGVARQVRERLKQHSLLVATTSSIGGVAFDHDDFRVLYLGESIGRSAADTDVADLKRLLALGTLPKGAVAEAILYHRRQVLPLATLLARMSGLAHGELPTSFVRDNCGALAIVAANGLEHDSITLTALTFPADSLEGARLHDITFVDCYFHPSPLKGTQLRGCVFQRCRFERLELAGETDVQAVLDDCEIGALVREDDGQVFDPGQIASALAGLGFTFAERGQRELPLTSDEPNEELLLLQRALRVFMRSTQVNEAVLRMRLGVRKATAFLDGMLPDLIRAGILQEVQYRGAGSGRRYGVAVGMHRIQEALAACEGDYGRFLAMFHQG